MTDCLDTVCSLKTKPRINWKQWIKHNNGKNLELQERR
jgi:hypothetical protein